MQPQSTNAHQRVKHEPTRLNQYAYGVQKGKPCRLFGNNFDSVAQAARHWGISYSWAREMIDKGMHQEAKPERKIHKGYRGQWRKQHETVQE